ncbi:hypothetical protein [Glycomyces buryatensis]|uniref:Uncharacterized protein n=1 Tax=Glycomyces buryatensis TaxID=2570927 RepID=A0A4S8QMQ6_9ACTN|nr:hypothetical protein [Glycomyces buryatensis]THV42719.1 hypothetical protein FAB82_04860 [Glycomyces buryatensis]
MRVRNKRVQLVCGREPLNDYRLTQAQDEKEQREAEEAALREGVDRAKRIALRGLKGGILTHSELFGGVDGVHMADALQELMDDGTVSRRTEYVYVMQD